MPELRSNRGGATFNVMNVAGTSVNGFRSGHLRSSETRRLGAYLAIGLFCGGLYVLIDQAFDARLGRGDLPPLLNHLHELVDLVLPLLAGASFGVSLHYLELRAARARDHARRADELAARLTRVERDQAAWVVVAATLHEIKNPLHSLGLLLGEVSELGPQERAQRSELLGRMNQQLARMQKNVDALRGLSVRSAPKPKRVDVAHTLREVGELLEVAGRTRAELKLHGPDRADVRADPTHLRIILENLLENALEAVEGVERARIDVHIVVQAAQVQVRISDSGSGVPEALRADLFEPLATSKSRGLGLGLPIARALARAMGGDVVLAESSGSKSEFVLSLPRSEP